MEEYKADPVGMAGKNSFYLISQIARCFLTWLSSTCAVMANYAVYHAKRDAAAAAAATAASSIRPALSQPEVLGKFCCMFFIRSGF